MNVQIEKLHGHIARLTVEIEAARLEKAKKQAARKLARRVNIPGFRKGKAPYSVLVSYVGEAPIIEEALENLGNDIYRDALAESQIEPYAMGSLENFELEPQPTFVFTVPMQPTVELNDYLSVRVDYEAPAVKDDDVEEALRQLREEHAIFEQSTKPAAIGDRITMDVTGHFADEDEAEVDTEVVDEVDAEADTEVVDEAADEEATTPEGDEDHDEEDTHDHAAPIHQHDLKLHLDEDREPVSGFAQALVGVQAGETRKFTLTYPEDEDKYDRFAGRVVKFRVDVTEVENVTLPALNDTFAELISDADKTYEGEEPLTLLELRVRLRETLQEGLEDNYKQDYLDEVMDELVQRAEFAYPEVMITNQIDGIVEQLADQFGVAVEDYLRLIQKNMDELYTVESYRKSAEKSIKRSLVMRGVLETENLRVDEADIDAKLDELLTQFGSMSEQYRSLFDTPEMRENMLNQLLDERIQDRIVGIGRGEEPEAEADAVEDAEPVVKADTDTVDAAEDADVAEEEKTQTETSE